MAVAVAPAALIALAWLGQGYAPPAPPPAYADRGTSEVSIAVGYGDGFIFGGGFRHFFWTGVGPGVEALVETGGSSGTVGLALGSLRLAPVRAGGFVLTLTGKGGRVLLSDHVDGWGVGGGAGIIILFASGAGLEIGYEALRLLPASFCADLSTCVVHGPVFGLRLVF